MSQWQAIVPNEEGYYFYRPYPGMPTAIVVRTSQGFLFPGVERTLRPRDMPGEFWDEPIPVPPA
jgi:hypothetical protein